ncbi:glucosamine 6-phosphate N-acetyltransferase, putative [Entamoeba invadens IP1]|uniref:glucosamine 6-phosphate N-acetyltransferase, putative n=1 Tax=Entamoeba invadens IP1 TaxID=370355 RepID=UPI0002C3E27A|nr:glucosamine 6-phosphate N-acetyltransferase, putative [Entamoeba invadens IP1]ELP93368.1 glucosamine 6-phosphate N-acetyltransferase, putative [Entamoeba invadens IP1]|eukprot:XP_004260139.1 glucosamine 6-phosphate N-acetyltransferase, putative [Entamoeba invadens IP1]
MSELFVLDFPYPRVGAIEFRPLSRNDYTKGVCKVLSQLTTCETSKKRFEEVFDAIQSHSNYFVIVAEDIETHQIVTMGTLLVESKFIHGGSNVGHIEDIVVSQEYRGLDLGKVLITTLLEIGKIEKCYKVILDCNDKVLKFYEKCGLTKHGNCMAHYYIEQ